MENDPIDGEEINTILNSHIFPPQQIDISDDYLNFNSFDSEPSNDSLASHSNTGTVDGESLTLEYGYSEESTVTSSFLTHSELFDEWYSSTSVPSQAYVVPNGGDNNYDEFVENSSSYSIFAGNLFDDENTSESNEVTTTTEEIKPKPKVNLKKRKRPSIDEKKAEQQEEKLRSSHLKPKKKEVIEPPSGFRVLPNGAPMPPPASPEKNYGSAPLVYLGGVKYRFFATMSTDKVTHSILTQVTPTKRQQPVLGKGQQIELCLDPNLLERLEVELTHELNYEITLDSIKKHQHVSRGSSQQQLTGSTAQQMFKMHALNITDVGPRTDNGYEWAHLWAWSLGGPQEKENLVAGTKESNIMTRALIENRIRELLETETNKVSVNVQLPCQSEFQKIPDLMVFNLTWRDKKTHKPKTLRIELNPRSSSAYTSGLGRIIKEAIDIPHYLDEEDKENQENNHTPTARQLFT